MKQRRQLRRLWLNRRRYGRKIDARRFARLTLPRPTAKPRRHLMGDAVKPRAQQRTTLDGPRLARQHKERRLKSVIGLIGVMQ
jgi:hypothetical protein